MDELMSAVKEADRLLEAEPVPERRRLGLGESGWARGEGPPPLNEQTAAALAAMKPSQRRLVTAIYEEMREMLPLLDPRRPPGRRWGAGG